MEAYSDSSFALAHEGHRSIQGSVVCIAGCPVLWSSSKQGLITQSTAESELLGYMECYQQAEGVAMLVETLLEKPVKRCVYGDNRSAVSLCTVDAGSWRTRHLRLRAAGLREAIMDENPKWLIHHIPGSSLVADGVTKALQGAAFGRFLELLQMEPWEEKEAKVARLAEDAKQRQRFNKGAVILGIAALMFEKPHEQDEMPVDDWLWCAAGLVIIGLVLVGALIKRGIWPDAFERSGRENEPPAPQVRRDPEPCTEEETRWDRENEPSPTQMSRDPEPDTERSKFRAHEPTWTGEKENLKSGRENGPPPSPCPHTSYRCQLGTPPKAGPSCGSSYGTSPPCSHGSSASPPDESKPWWNRPPSNENERKKWAAEGWWWNGRTWCHAVGSEEGEPMVCILRAKPPPPEVILHPPWLDPQFQKAPIGSKDSWLSLCGWLCRVHRKPRTQLCHPLHSTNPCSPDHDLTGCRTTIFFREDSPHEPYQLSDDWTVSPTREGREAMKQLGKWRGFTFFELRNKFATQPESEVQQGWHGTAWLAPDTGGTMRSDWETILKFNRQQAALGKPQIPVGRLNQMRPPEVPKLRMEKVQHPVVYPSSTRVEVGRPLIEVGPNEEVYPSPERATEWNLAQQQMRMAAQPDSEPSSQTVSSGTGTLETSTSGQQSLESSSSGKQTMPVPPRN